MVSFSAVCLVLILTISLKIILNFIKGSRSHLKCSLKGPSGVPILGNVFPLLRNYKAPMKQYTDWAKSFGGIYKIRVGSQAAVVLSDLKLFNKAFISQGPKFHFRPRGTVLSVILGNKGIVTSDGSVWHQHRKFLLRKLQQLQVGKQSKHEMVFAETEKLVYKIQSGLLRSDINHTDGDDYDPLADIGVSIFNTMWNFIGSENVAKGEDERIRKFLYESSGEMQVAEMGGVWNYALILQLIWIFWNNPVKLLMSTIRKSFFISKEIRSKNNFEADSRRVEKSNHQNNETENLTSLYLQEMGNPDTEFTTFSGSQLRATLRDLIAAGVDTTFTTIRWILLLLAKNQDCLIKLQNELEVALTKKTLFELSSYAARYDLPYLEAVTIETLRYRPTIHTICHTIQEDIILTDDSSYSTSNQTHIFIPRDTWVIGNIWGIHHDENVWKNPEIFNPERFIESNGKINKELANKCIPFSSGVRKCAGELMARVELYSFLVTLLSNFDVKLDAESLRTTTLEEPIVGVSLMPPKHKLVFTSRR